MTRPDWLQRGLCDLFPDGDGDDCLARRLAGAERKGEPLRVKLGIDPTGVDLHLGHTIVFRKLRAFQDAGHTAVLIIGDFTARIGDPTGKSVTRPTLSAEQVEVNARTYLDQLRPVLDFDTPGRLEVRRNSEWLAALTLSDVIGLLGTTTVGQMLAKEDFSGRYRGGTPIHLHEFLYPLLQGYDSVAVKADVELGGSDQKFNVAMGRAMQRHYGCTPQFGLLMPILPGTDGIQKMSKSLGNAIGLQDDALSVYSRLEKVADDAIDDYVTLLTDLDPEQLPAAPRQRQKAMALAVTTNLHGAEAAQQAQATAEAMVLRGQTEIGDDSVPAVSLSELSNLAFPTKAFYLTHAVFSDVNHGNNVGITSTSEARRKIQGGAVRLNGEKLTDPNREFRTPEELSGQILQLGKKNFRRLVD